MNPKDLPSVFQRNLRAIRAQRQKSVRTLAAELGVSQTTIVSWETGKTTPNLDAIVSLAEVLKVAPESLITEGADKILSTAS